jgi:hypothetical protein
MLAQFRLCSAVIVVWAALSPLVPDACADEVYKSVDAQGHVVYSDRAPTAKAPKSIVNVIQGNPAEAARAAQETNILKTEEALRKRNEAAQSQQQARQEHDKQAQCQNARNRYFSIKDANVLYRLDSQGNRVFYSDAEGDARKEQARQAMISACGR